MVETLNNDITADPTEKPPNAVSVDAQGKRLDLEMLSISRPHMSTFHIAWISYLFAFQGWFAIPALIVPIRKSLQLNRQQVILANALSTFGTATAQVFAGVLCDRFGARLTFVFSVLVFSIPVGLVGLCNSFVPFAIVRYFAGMTGATFVAVTALMSAFFNQKIIGAATAITAGFGTAGSGLGMFVMPAIFSSIPLQPDAAWRVTFVYPAVCMWLAAALLFFLSKDSPPKPHQPPYPIAPHQSHHLPPNQTSSVHVAPSTKKRGALSLLLEAGKDYRSWVLGLATWSNFGAFLAVNNFVSEYFFDRFGLSVSVAGAVSSSFSLSTIIARPIGGILSDKVGRRFGLVGRLRLVLVLALIEGMLIIVFSFMDSLPSAVATMILFSICSHMGAGATFLLGQFVNPKAPGGVTGIMACTTNVGAGVILLLFRAANSYSSGFLILGVLVLTLPTTAFMALRFPDVGFFLTRHSVMPTSHMPPHVTKSASASDPGQSQSRRLSDHVTATWAIELYEGSVKHSASDHDSSQPLDDQGMYVPSALTNSAYDPVQTSTANDKIT